MFKDKEVELTLKDLQDGTEIWKPGKVKLDFSGKLVSSAPDVTPPQYYCPKGGGAHSVKLAINTGDGNEDQDSEKAMFLTVVPPPLPPSAIAPDASIGMPNAAPGFA